MIKFIILYMILLYSTDRANHFIEIACIKLISFTLLKVVLYTLTTKVKFMARIVCFGPTDLSIRLR